MNENNLYNEETRSVDKRTEENLAALEDIFNRSDKISEEDLPFQNTAYNINELQNNNLEKTGKIDEVELEELKKIRDALKQLNEEENIDSSEEQSKTQEKGRQKTLSLPGFTKQDVEEITNSFINCFVLAFVTASMGTGWLLYLITQII